MTTQRATPNTQHSGRLPSLDGLRAVSIALVTGRHILSGAGFNDIGFGLAFYVGQLGVSIFFVISGFIITHLLIAEKQSSGRISLRDFYFRRSFRILPPAFTYLAVIAILIALNVISLPPAEYFAALFFFRDYVYPKSSLGPPWVGHFWSLSIEEQFYVFWPAIIAFLPRRKAVKVAGAIIIIEPVARVITYFTTHSLRGSMGSMFHTRLDSIMIGCMAAFIYNDSRFSTLDLRRLRPWLLRLSTSFLIASPMLDRVFGGAYSLPFGFMLEGVSTATVILLTVTSPDQSVLGKILNWKGVIVVGLASYSIYIWQELFLTSHSFHIGGHFFFNILAAIAAGFLSYRFIETPAKRICSRLRRECQYVKIGHQTAAAGITSS